MIEISSNLAVEKSYFLINLLHMKFLLNVLKNLHAEGKPLKFMGSLRLLAFEYLPVE